MYNRVRVSDIKTVSDETMSDKSESDYGNTRQ